MLSGLATTWVGCMHVYIYMYYMYIQYIYVHICIQIYVYDCIRIIYIQIDMYREHVIYNGFIVDVLCVFIYIYIYIYILKYIEYDSTVHKCIIDIGRYIGDDLNCTSWQHMTWGRQSR